MAKHVQKFVGKLWQTLGLDARKNGRATVKKPSARPQVEILENREVPANFGTIQGTIFLDAHVNGALDSKDVRLPGVKVTLIGTSTGTDATTNTDAGDNTGIRVTAVTNALGTYKFTNVPAAGYTFRLETAAVPGLTKGVAQAVPTISMATDLQSETRNFMFTGGIKPSLFSLRQFNTNASVLSFPYNPAGSGTAVVNHAPTASTIPNITTTAGSANTIKDLAGFFKDADFTNSQITFKIDDGTGDSKQIKMTLFDAQAPQTVTNFLDYVTNNKYDASIFHRLTNKTASGIGVLQGGSLTVDATGKILSDVPVIPIGATVPNEFRAGNSNVKGTIAMAQAGGANTATNQFFFNTTNNATSLDSQKFAVFGKVADATSQTTLDGLTTIPTKNLSGSAPIALATATTPGATESGGTVTITTTEPHDFVVGQSVTISGVSVAGYNGTFTILTVSPTSFTYTNPTTGLANSGGTAAVPAKATVPASVASAHPTALLNDLPLANNYAGNVTTFSGDANLNNYVRITDITIDKRDEFLSFSLVDANGGGNAAVAVATITNEYLTIDPVAAGTTTFTIKATDRYGAEVTKTVTVTVT